MALTGFEELTKKVKASGITKKIVVVSADDAHTLEAVMTARKDGLVEPVFVGDTAAIKATVKELGEDPEVFEIYEETDFDKAAEKGVKLIREGKGDFLMKGKLETSQILRAVVNPETGLGMGGVMSHIAINDVPSYHKFLLTTDGGMNVKPNFNMKLGILVNAVNTLRALGYEKPKVAVLANSEVVDPKIEESVEAGKLKDMFVNGEIKNCIVEGPVALDIALVKERAEVKHFESPVAGDADIILSPNIFTSNTLGKSLVEMAGAKMAGLIVGAKVPIRLTSRGSSSEEKYNSIVLAAAVAANSANITNDQVADLTGLKFW
jgi:phosphate butyryltransferase